MIGTKKKDMEQALASCMRLLVLVRETLVVLGDEKSPLFAAVAAHASLCGTLIPDKSRMSAEELATVRAQIRAGTMPAVPAEDRSKPNPNYVDPADLQARLAGGNVIVLQRRADGKLFEGPGLPGLKGQPIKDQPK